MRLAASTALNIVSTAASGHRDAENGISDAPEERYEFSISLPGSTARGEHTVAFAPTNRFENVGSAKTTIRVP